MKFTFECHLVANLAERNFRLYLKFYCMLIVHGMLLLFGGVCAVCTV